MGGNDKWTIGTGRIDNETDIKFYNDAQDLFSDMYRAIKTTRSTNHLIAILGWHVEIEKIMPLVWGDESTCLRAVLKEADERKVTIRAMFDYDYEPKFTTRNKENGNAVSFINSLSNGAAILDRRKLIYGSHHQKVLIASGDDGIIAFVGGFDIHPHRWPWVDVHCRLIGGGARFLIDLFRERWDDHPNKSKIFPLIEAIQKQKKGSTPVARVQITRTYGNPIEHGGLDWFERGVLLDISKAVTPPETYEFAKAGEFSIYMLILHSIKRAINYIYVEDQYLFASEMKRLPDIRNVLAARLGSVPNLKLIVLIGRTENINEEVKQGWLRRRLFIQKVAAGNPGKVFILQYKKTDNPIVHSKCLIFDDEFAIVGSANCNRRSYSHDSEVAVGISGKNPEGDQFAKELRVQLWLRHLNPPGGAPPKFKKEHLSDWIDGLKLMLLPNSRLELYNPNAGTDKTGGLQTIGGRAVPGPEASWEIIDPDGS